MPVMLNLIQHLLNSYRRFVTSYREFLIPDFQYAIKKRKIASSFLIAMTLRSKSIFKPIAMTLRLKFRHCISKIVCIISVVSSSKKFCLLEFLYREQLTDSLLDMLVPRTLSD